MFGYERTDDRLTVRADGTRWLSNGFDGGYTTADAAHNFTVPEGFERTDLGAYVTERLGAVPDGPALLTAVPQTNARGASHGPIEAVVTAGLSNPALLAVGDPPDNTDDAIDGTGAFRPGTINVFVGSSAPLTDGGLAGLLATAVESKAATLSELAGCTGTTSDAIVVGCSDGTDATPFAGGATVVGNAARVCVRDALEAALRATYGRELPDPHRAEHATVTSGAADVFEP